MPAGKGTDWEGKIPDVSLEDSVAAYQAAVDDLRLETTDTQFDGRVMQSTATWPTGPLAGDKEASVTCRITGKKDGVILLLDVDGSPERLQQVIRAMERHGVPVRERGEPKA